MQDFGLTFLAYFWKEKKTTTKPPTQPSTKKKLQQQNKEKTQSQKPVLFFFFPGRNINWNRQKTPHNFLASKQMEEVWGTIF